MLVVPLRYDVSFKKAFGQKDIFCQFVEDVLGIRLNIDEVHREYQMTEPVGKVKVAYDLYAEDKEQRIIVELQHIKEADFFDRFLYYHLIGMIEQVNSFKDYNFLKTVYTIVMLTGKPKKGDPDFSMGCCEMPVIDERGKRWELYKHRLVFLNPHQVNDDTPETVRRWLEVVEDSLDEQVEESIYEADPLLLRLLRSIQQQELTPEELSEIKDDAAWERAKWEAKEEGREEGIEKGIEQGIEKGIEKVARRMLEEGMEPGTVAAVTGLSLEEIQDLKAEQDAE